MSANLDNREDRFLQVGDSLLFSKAVQELHPGARWLYICMATESGGQRRFKLSHGKGRRYGFSDTTFDRYVYELEAGGFIKRIPPPGGEQYVTAEFEFSLAWKQNPRPILGRSVP